MIGLTFLEGAARVQSIATLVGRGVPMLFAKDPCPKCGGLSWYELEGSDTVLHRCHCGLCKVVQTVKGGMVVKHTQKESEVQLPRRGSKLSQCLGVVAAHYPRELKTSEIAELAGQSNSDVASKLMVLEYKGLVFRVEEGRGKSGGSTWALTKRAIKRLRIKE